MRFDVVNTAISFQTRSTSGSQYIVQAFTQRNPSDRASKQQVATDSEKALGNTNGEAAAKRCNVPTVIKYVMHIFKRQSSPHLLTINVVTFDLFRQRL